MGNFCPFIKDKCKSDCVFHISLMEMSNSPCLISNKLDKIAKNQLLQIKQKTNPNSY